MKPVNKAQRIQLEKKKKQEKVKKLESKKPLKGLAKSKQSGKNFINEYDDSEN